MDKLSEPSDNLEDAMNSLSGWKKIAEAAETKAESLLAELEASKKSNAFLKEQLSQLANFNPDWDMLEACRESWREVSAALKEAETRLATPVRLPEKYNMKMAGDKSTKSMFYGHNSAINDSAKAIRAAGFTVEGG